MKTALKLVGALLATVLLVLALPVYMYFGRHNFRTVDDGDFYGSRQMSGAALEKAIRDYGIGTVVNLRGKNPGTDWYDEEVAVCQRLNVAHEDFPWSKNSLPDPQSLARFVELVETGKRPFLAHCEGGTHRTGVAAACYLLCKGADIATARKQFGPMFKDAPIGKVVDLYEGSDMAFPQWVREVYPSHYESMKTSRLLDQVGDIAGKGRVDAGSLNPHSQFAAHVASEKRRLLTCEHLESNRLCHPKLCLWVLSEDAQNTHKRVCGWHN